MTCNCAYIRVYIKGEVMETTDNDLKKMHRFIQKFTLSPILIARDLEQLKALEKRLWL